MNLQLKRCLQEQRSSAVCSVSYKWLMILMSCQLYMVIKIQITFNFCDSKLVKCTLKKHYFTVEYKVKYRMTEYKINSWQHGVILQVLSFSHWKVIDSILNYILWCLIELLLYVKPSCKVLAHSQRISIIGFFTKKTVGQKEIVIIILLKVLKRNTTYCIVFPMFLTVLVLL